ncbi:urea amidolyase associated protein UAAP1 [Corynebacterium sp.]|uniref:urea amidolyase associated protein UAAP1 n=1 Tax=Corynebacterium sp. TaxID=1720 RepID=UPI003B3BCC83
MSIASTQSARQPVPAEETTRDLHRTDSVTNARSDARAQGTQSNPYMPYLPASDSPYAPEDVNPEDLTWAETVGPGGYTHKVVARGTRIRLEDVDGTTCAHVLLFNALEPWERYNAADSIKIPWQAYVTTGHPLLSGEGRVLATVAEDTSAHHDTFCGTMTDTQTACKYGAPAIHGIYPSGQGLFEQAGAKHGLEPRDLPPSISFFKGARAEEDGTITFTGGAGEGTHVDLIAEMPLVILIANAPHPLDPATDYVSGPLRVHAWRGEPTQPSEQMSPENTRAYLNTVDYTEARAL